MINGLSFSSCRTATWKSSSSVGGSFVMDGGDWTGKGEKIKTEGIRKRLTYSLIICKYIPVACEKFICNRTRRESDIKDDIILLLDMFPSLILLFDSVLLFFLLTTQVSDNRFWTTFVFNGLVVIFLLPVLVSEVVAHLKIVQVTLAALVTY